MWVKFPKLKLTAPSTKIISMGTDYIEIASVSVKDNGVVAYTYMGQTINDISIRAGEWSLIGIGLEETDDGIFLYTNVNEYFVTRKIIIDGNDVENITRILLGEYRDANVTNTHLSVGTDLEMPFDVLYAGIGAYKHDKSSYNGIYYEGYKYIFQTVANPATGVIYYNPEIYKDMDVIPLNGSLNSSKGLKPLEHTYLDSTFKSPKARVFELDRKQSLDDEDYTNRHIYGSYSDKSSLDGDSRSLLVYDFGIQNQGTISLRFKCDYVEDERKYPQRTILYCSSPTGDVNSLIIWIDNKTQQIKVGVPSILEVLYTSLTVTPETWHLLTLTWDTNEAILKLDNQTYAIYPPAIIDLTGCKTYIGSTIINDKAENHLIGNIEMLSYSDIKMTTIHDTIINNGKLISVLTEYDEVQRPFKKVIDTGKLRLNHHYKYNDENLKISLAPDMEIYPDGTKVIYSYDRSGNIVHQVKSKNGSLGENIHYKYDVSSRLLSEKCYNDNILTYCYEYLYDNNGNITYKFDYNIDGTIKSKETYYYSSTIKDQLLRIQTSDSLGAITYTHEINYNLNDPFRPNSYKGNALTWEGRRLTRFGDFTYEYNSDGIRVSKNINNNITSFVLDGSKIIKEIKPSYTVYYHYDEKGMLTGFNYNSDEYFYIRSLTGNIEKIIDSQGNIKVEYQYDAWGNVLSSTGNESIKNANSFLYKGYYYDVETGLYLLTTRYYDPRIGRFISADDINYLEPESIGGLNLFAYCKNNPIMFYDPSGNFLISALIIAGVLLFTPVGGVVTQAVVSTVSYVGMSAAAVGNKVFGDGKLWDDMCAIKWNPFNSNEALVQNSNSMSFYKGVPVFHISGMGGSMSLGAIFYDKDQGIKVLKHERGHSSQLMRMGLGNYLIQIGIPSIWKNGDETPWELSASMLGGSTLANNASNDQKSKARMYNTVASIPIANIANIIIYLFY